MEQIHVHEVLRMMEGNGYTEATLTDAVKKRFGENQRFCACSDADMDTRQMVAFLQKKGKFKPLDNGAFTSDTTGLCDGNGNH